jgi:hypothetical protein
VASRLEHNVARPGRARTLLRSELIVPLPFRSARMLLGEFAALRDRSNCMRSGLRNQLRELFGVHRRRVSLRVAAGHTAADRSYQR